MPPHCHLALVAVLAGIAAPAAAQEEDYRTIVTIMRACSQIEDIGARVTCYDNNVGPRGTGSPAIPTAPAAPAPEFGSETLPAVREAARQNQGPDEILRRVGTVEELAPGQYLLALDDGSQWRFAESTGLSYFPPAAGAQVRIARGALGSYRLHADGQRAVRVVRVR